MWQISRFRLITALVAITGIYNPNRIQLQYSVAMLSRQSIDSDVSHSELGTKVTYIYKSDESL